MMRIGRQEGGSRQSGFTVAELITVAIKGDELRADPSSIAVRLSFDPPIDRAASAENDEEEE